LSCELNQATNESTNNSTKLFQEFRFNNLEEKKNNFP
jgi:hypothetical protein